MPITRVTTATKAGRRTKQDKPPRDIRKEIKTLYEQIEQNWFDFSLAAAEIYDGELYKSWGYASINEYLQEDLGIEYRMFMYRVHMGHTINGLGLSKAQIGRIGWSKFKEVAHLLEKDMTKGEVDGILNHARGMSFRQVQDYVRMERHTRDLGEVHKKVRYTFNFIDEQASIIDNAIQEAMQLLNTESREVALEYICQEWSIRRDPKLVAEITKRLTGLDAQEPQRAKHKTHANKGKKYNSEVASKVGEAESTQGEPSAN